MAPAPLSDYQLAPFLHLVLIAVLSVPLYELSNKGGSLLRFVFFRFFSRFAPAFLFANDVP
jgi:hypothetical protein